MNEIRAGVPKPTPDLSLIMPCYNEQEVVGYTIPRLLNAFAKAGHALQLIAVDNGSADRTGEIIRQFVASGAPIIYCRVDKNEGYGNGILSGIPLATAPWIGTIASDGQVDAEDIVQLYEAVAATNGMVLGKVRRRFRMDGLSRKFVSMIYNLLVIMLFPGIGSLDINGIPKLMPRELVSALSLKSKGWFLDPEIMIKSRYLGVRVIEFNVFARMRGNGISHVRAETCLEFLSQLLYYRFSPEISVWKQELPVSTFTDRVTARAQF